MNLQIDTFTPFLLTQFNSPFNDNHLMLSHTQLKDTLLFDIGDISAIPIKTLLRIRYIFVTHNHMDHFCGFPYFLRNILRLKNRTITLFGTKDFIKKLVFSVQSFEWNLVDETSPLFEIYEVHKDYIYYLPATLFYTIDAENPYKNVEKLPFNNTLLTTPHFSVQTVILNHKIPVLGFKLISTPFIKVIEEKIAPYKKGPWLSIAKKMLTENRELSTPIKIDENTTLPLSTIKDFFTFIPPYIFSYITDFAYNKENVALLIPFIKESDALFIESHFLQADENLARETFHLTTKDVAQLVKPSSIKQFFLTHFSQRYIKTNTVKDFYNEVKENFNQ